MKKFLIGFILGALIFSLIPFGTLKEYICYKADGKEKKTIVLFGDSITAYNASLGDQGFFTWANVFLGQRFEVLNCAGVAENTTAQMLTRIQTDVIDYAPDYCFVMGGLNDTRASIDSETTIANLKAIYAALKDAEINVIAATLTPDDSVYKGQWYEVNDWIRSNVKSDDVIVIEIGKGMIDPTNGNPLKNTTIDNLHPSPFGAFLMGKEVYRQLDGLIKPVDSFVIKNGDDNVLNPNPMMLGDNSGVADFSAFLSGDVTPSKVARKDGIGGEWQQVTTSTETVADFGQSTATGFSVGDEVYGQCEIEVKDITSLKKVELWVGAWDLEFMPLEVTKALSHDDSYADVNNGNWSGVLKTGTITIPENTNTIIIQLRFTGIATYKIGRMEIRKK